MNLGGESLRSPLKIFMGATGKSSRKYKDYISGYQN